MTDAPTPSRFPRSVYGEGTEPDPRFTLANERTFLAWIRTALALIAAGVALEALGLGIHPQLRLAASLVLILVGIATPVQAWFGWMSAERAMRRERPLPAARLALPVGIAIVVAGVLIVVGVFLA